MIFAATWFFPGHCGVVMPQGRGSWNRVAPQLSAAEEVLALIGRPVRFFSRMTAESQMCLCAARLALQATQWEEKEPHEIGLLAGGFDGFLVAEKDYFADYVANGRTLGRANLFVYTLPTSAASAVSIGLALTGPVLHLHADRRALRSMVLHGEQMITDGEADGMLLLWGDPLAAVCLAIDGTGESGYAPAFQPDFDLHPLPLAQALESLTPKL